MKLIDKDEFMDLFHMYCNLYEDIEDAYSRALDETPILYEGNTFPISQAQIEFTETTEIKNKPEC